MASWYSPPQKRNQCINVSTDSKNVKMHSLIIILASPFIQMSLNWAIISVTSCQPCGQIWTGAAAISWESLGLMIVLHGCTITREYEAISQNQKNPRVPIIQDDNGA